MRLHRLTLLALACALAGCWGDPFEYVDGVTVDDWSVVPRAQAQLPPNYPIMGGSHVLSGTAVNGLGAGQRMVALVFENAEGQGVQVQIVGFGPGERRYFAVGVPSGTDWEYTGAADYSEFMP